MDSQGGSEKDIICRIGKARTAFSMMSAIWRAGNIALNTKLRLLNSNIKTILFETWKATKHLVNKLQVFTNTCLRQILKIRWSEKITNTALWEKTNHTPMESELKKESGVG